MSENISSNVLFHFTKSVDNLVDILKSGFYPHYCPEYSFGPLHAKAASEGLSPAHAAPMTCFCDLPLSLIRRHLREYGSFGIGLDKSWGIKHGVTPVFYLHEHAQLFNPLSERMWAARNANDAKAINDLTLLAAYLKPYIGNAWRNGKVEPDVHFYDEREWRYVPNLEVGKELFLTREEYSEANKVDLLHASFKQKCNLPVHPDYIQYLIVPDDGHVLELAKHLRNLYDPNNAILTTTAIMTVNCIEEDV